VSTAEDMGVLLPIKQKDAAAVSAAASSARSVPGEVVSEVVVSERGSRPAGSMTRTWRSGTPASVRRPVPGRRPACPWGEHVWFEQRAADRPGWWRGWCERCGKFLGYRHGDARVMQSGERGPGGVWR
jgi:hypothetical protein